MKTVDFLHLKYEIIISYRQYLKGNSYLKAIVLVQDKPHARFWKDLVPGNVDNWQYFLHQHGLDLLEKQKDLAYQISDAFSESLISQLEKLGFKKGSPYPQRNWIQYYLSSNNVFEVNNILSEILLETETT